eukprot:gene15223-18014_t
MKLFRNKWLLRAVFEAVHRVNLIHMRSRCLKCDGSPFPALVTMTKRYNVIWDATWMLENKYYSLLVDKWLRYPDRLTFPDLCIRDLIEHCPRDTLLDIIAKQPDRFIGTKIDDVFRGCAALRGDVAIFKAICPNPTSGQAFSAIRPAIRSCNLEMIEFLDNCMDNKSGYLLGEALLTGDSKIIRYVFDKFNSVVPFLFSLLMSAGDNLDLIRHMGRFDDPFNENLFTKYLGHCAITPTPSLAHLEVIAFIETAICPAAPLTQLAHEYLDIDHQFNDPSVPPQARLEALFIELMIGLGREDRLGETDSRITLSKKLADLVSFNNWILIRYVINVTKRIGMKHTAGVLEAAANTCDIALVELIHEGINYWAPKWSARNIDIARFMYTRHNKSNATSLLHAATIGDLDTVKFLVSLGADPNPGLVLSLRNDHVVVFEYLAQQSTWDSSNFLPLALDPPTMITRHFELINRYFPLTFPYLAKAISRASFYGDISIIRAVHALHPEPFYTVAVNDIVDNALKAGHMDVLAYLIEIRPETFIRQSWMTAGQLGDPQLFDLIATKSNISHMFEACKAAYLHGQKRLIDHLLVNHGHVMHFHYVKTAIQNNQTHILEAYLELVQPTKSDLFQNFAGLPPKSLSSSTWTVFYNYIGVIKRSDLPKRCDLKFLAHLEKLGKVQRSYFQRLRDNLGQPNIKSYY